MVISVLTFSRFPEEMLQGKAPFFAFGWLLLLGNWLFFAAEWLSLPHETLIGARVLMSLGFGAAYVAKRRAAGDPLAKRREYHFMRLELCNSLGMACGPILSGLLALCFPRGSQLWPPLAMSLFALCFLVALTAVPLHAQARPRSRGMWVEQC